MRHEENHFGYRAFIFGARTVAGHGDTTNHNEPRWHQLGSMASCNRTGGERWLYLGRIEERGKVWPWYVPNKRNSTNPLHLGTPRDGMDGTEMPIQYQHRAGHCALVLAESLAGL